LGDLDPIDAAPLMCAGITTYSVIRQALPLLTPGSSTVLIGVGGLGHLAIQILKALSPTRIIAVDAYEDKLAHALQLGANHAVQAGPEAAAKIRALTGGRGAELVIDMVGADATMAFSQAVLAQRGQIKLVGVAGGTLPVRYFEMPRESSIGVTYAGTIPDLFEVVRLAEAGLIKPEVTHIGFDQLDETFARMDAGQLRGRAVLVPTL
jgi:propanol-preferring alcohol dehydrogenase